ncbi:MAG: excinuclease ABC subunit UvrA [Patescibacteria group bacterium]
MTNKIDKTALKTNFLAENTDQTEIFKQLKEYNTTSYLDDNSLLPNPHNYITVRGAREHNLKNISIVIPKNKMVVFTGLSGSGKSSLVFDTIYAEGQRRYVESLSSYARQFLGLKEKPDLDSVDGLSPAISIDQKSTSQNPRSTVGTTTEIYDYMRLLFSKIGVQHCAVCGAEITGESVTKMVDRISKIKKDSNIIILSPVVEDQKGWHRQHVLDTKKNGFRRMRVDGQIMLIEELDKMELNKQQKHSLEIVVDRLLINKENKSRLTDSLETALKFGKEKAIILHIQDNGEEEKLYFNKNRACPNGHGSPGELEPRQFSFNSPHGACPTCSGLGVITEIDSDLVVPNPSLSIMEGCIRPLSRLSISGGWLTQMFESLAKKYKFKLTTPWKDLSDKQRNTILYGDTSFEGVITNLQRRYRETTSEASRRDIENYMTKKVCHTCKGARLKPESLAVTIADSNIHDITQMPINQAFDHLTWIQGKSEKPSPLREKDLEISKMILKEINTRLNFLVNVGLQYLTLGRSSDTLSGGEAQRIRLATQIGSGLTGVLYILDEPSIGLHQRDNTRLLGTLKHLRDLGNTVLVVEHDEETMRESDYLVDIGPMAGKHGGQVVAIGTPDEITKNPDSPTGRFLAGTEKIPVPAKRRTGVAVSTAKKASQEKNINKGSIEILGARENNLKEIDVSIPLKKFVCISGVSGSGKSTLINDIFANHLMNYFYDSHLSIGKFERIDGLNNIDKPIIIDQSPIGRTPRSNPATYTGLFTPIRELFSNLPESKARGYTQGRFSFNVAGGRCETCQGDGIIKVEMNFLPDVYVVCEDCGGKRYNRETLEITYRDKTIADILAMPVEEALEFFTNHSTIKRKLQTLCDVGLGYIHLGQSATTLSGGEAQRIKLATELSKIGTGNTLYILDEPTTGLHPLDVRLLLDVLHKLVDKGNTVLVIEHNLDVIKTADWIIDLGPEGGNNGGEIVAVGTPEEVASNPRSFTGGYLKKSLA